MSEDVIELQYRDDSTGKTDTLKSVNTKQQKQKPKGGKSHSYEHLEQHAYEEEELGDIEAGAGELTNTNKKVKDTAGHLLLSLYTINFVAILAFMIAAFAAGGDDKDLMMILILICVLLTTVLSAIALFKYGRLQDQVSRLKEENRVYDMELIELKGQRGRLEGEVDDLESENVGLNTDCNDLQGHINEFGDLLDELKTISKDGEDIVKVADEINNAFDKMNDLVYQNERTHLLTSYYQAAFRDKDNDMNKIEYQRFLTKIAKKFRNRFNNLGTFEQLLRKYECEQESIDLQTFLHMADDVLAQSEDVLRDEFIREYSVHRTLVMSEQNADVLRSELRSS